MSNLPVKNFTNDEVSLIKDQIARGASDGELKLFLYQAQKTGLDPLANQLYFIRYKEGSKATFQAAIDGLRLVAMRTGEHAGCDIPKFDNEDKPSKCVFTVYRIVKGVRCPFHGIAYWSEFYPGDGGRGSMWRKMPKTMLAKCAESQALRKAFPAELSGIYSTDEMDQAGEPIVSQPADSAQPSTPMTQKFEQSLAVYMGTPQQKDILREAFKSVGIKDNEVMRRLSEEFMNQPMDELTFFIEIAIAEGRAG